MLPYIFLQSGVLCTYAHAMCPYHTKAAMQQCEVPANYAARNCFEIMKAQVMLYLCGSQPYKLTKDAV